jgi:hypothetical protein
VHGPGAVRRLVGHQDAHHGHDETIATAYDTTASEDPQGWLDVAPPPTEQGAVSGGFAL